jgi:hypothetical protein
VKRLEWSGHLICANENTMIRKVFNTNSEVTKKMGRPRLRWEEYVWQNIRILGIRNCKNLASNREEWLGYSEEGHGPHRALVPKLMLTLMMMMMMMMRMMMKTGFLGRSIVPSTSIMHTNVIQPGIGCIMLSRIQLEKTS